MANTAFTDDGNLERTRRRALRHIQLRPDLIGGCLAGTGLTVTHQPTLIRCEAVTAGDGEQHGRQSLIQGVRMDAGQRCSTSWGPAPASFASASQAYRAARGDGGC